MEFNLGVQHSDFGEGVVAICVRKNDTISLTDNELSEQIAKIVHDQLAPYKIPKKWVFVNELPRNAMGKIQKNLLREANKDIFVL